MRKTIVISGIAAGILLLIFGGWQLSRSRSLQLYGGLITHVETDSMLVALTLDDGPTPAGTEATLAILDSLDVVATFFVTGREMNEHMAYGRRIVEAGHALGNHSYTHQQMVLRSPAFMAEEIVTTDSLIRAAGWAGDIPFRPPYAKRLFVLPRYLHQNNRNTFLWDIEPESFREIAKSPEQMAAHVADRVRPGSIILMHVMYSTREESRLALPKIISQLKEKGYRFVTLQELLKHGHGTS